MTKWSSVPHELSSVENERTSSKVRQSFKELHKSRLGLEFPLRLTMIERKPWCCTVEEIQLWHITPSEFPLRLFLSNLNPQQPHKKCPNQRTEVLWQEWKNTSWIGLPQPPTSYTRGISIAPYLLRPLASKKDMLHIFPICLRFKLWLEGRMLWKI